MIIFTILNQIPEEYLEYKGIKQTIVYNLTSYFTNGSNLNLLIPSIESVSEDVLRGDCSVPTFDISYHNYILNNDGAFIQFMNIMVPVFNSPDVLVQIMIMRSQFSDAIVESLIKLIQQRYGYNSYLINDIDDFLYTEESDLSIPGLFMMDKDLERWRCLIGVERCDIYE